MENILNDFELKKPPLVTVMVPNTAFAKQIHIAINSYLKQMSAPDAKEFNQEAALLARLMARRKNSFRGMIGFRSVHKLNASLCRLLRVDLLRDLESFRGALPDIYDDGLSGDMPTRSSFEYVLVRLISVHYVYKRIGECCKHAADFFTKMLRSAFFLEYNTLLIANIAKINSLSRKMNEKCVELYNKIVPYEENFPEIARHKFLPEEVKLPSCLDTGKVYQMKDNKQLEIRTLTKAPNAPKVKKIVDLGCTVEREIAPVKKDFNIEKLDSVPAIKSFIECENQARQAKSKQYLTQNIAKHEWLAAQRLFERKLLAQEHKKAISVFRKFISSKF